MLKCSGLRLLKDCLVVKQRAHHLVSKQGYRWHKGSPQLSGWWCPQQSLLPHFFPSVPLAHHSAWHKWLQVTAASCRAFKRSKCTLSRRNPVYQVRSAVCSQAQGKDKENFSPMCPTSHQSLWGHSQVSWAAKRRWGFVTSLPSKELVHTSCLTHSRLCRVAATWPIASKPGLWQPTSSASSSVRRFCGSSVGLLPVCPGRTKGAYREGDVLGTAIAFVFTHSPSVTCHGWMVLWQGHLEG